MTGHRVGVRPPVIRREERRRRLLLLAIVAALLLGIAPVVGHHVLGAVPWLSAQQHHLAMLCLVALHLLLRPVHEIAHWLLYTGLAYVVLERGRAFWQHWRVMRALPQARVSPASALGQAAVRAGLPVTRTRVVRGLPMPAFTSGWFAPRVIVAADLPDRLASDELTAVLAHEAVHLRRRDPLRLFALRALASLLFWLPVLRRLAADLEDEVEITADDEVPAPLALALASAVLTLGAGTERAVPGTVGFQRADLLPRRIRRLAGEDAEPVSHTSTGSLLAATAALVLVWSAGVIVLHPLRDATTEATQHASHCDHPGETPLTHVFCRGWSLGLSGERRCPHEAARV
ncbi:MAG: M56 family metallopeptidase [Gemmatimonadetes bacterium]|nr:M56 family metallopeptidase [Gemmatimonadota bacterium]